MQLRRSASEMSFKNLNEFLKSKLSCGFRKSDESKNTPMPAIISDILNAKSNDIVGVKHSYNHIYRRKTKWELSRLSFAMMGIEIVYAILTAFVSPVLLMYGVQREHATLVWVIGPLMGLVFSPILGSLSDRCRFSIGRRRPFIIFLATLNVAGLLLIANSNYVGKLFGDREADIFSPTKSLSSTDGNAAGIIQQDVAGTKISYYIWTVIFLIIGAVTVDFSCDTLQNPSRAYVLDVCVVEDHDKGLNSCTILAGCGGLIGYIIGAVEWHNTFLNEIIGSYMQVMFYLVATLFVICILATVTTFREIPLKKSQHIESSLSTDTLPAEPAIKLLDYLKSIISMPYSLRILCITNLFCWMSHITFCLYFTDFVGRAVFDGNPSAPPDSIQYKSYEEGIRFGCSALCGYSVACIAYSLVAEKIIKCVGLKSVYIGTICLDSLCLILMAVVKAKIVVIILSAISGIIYCTIVTIPYMLIAHYHVKKTFHVDKNGKQLSTTQVRGLGTDLAIVGACLCVAQLIVSFSMGKLMSLFGVTFAVIGTSAFFACLAAITAFYVVYLDL